VSRGRGHLEARQSDFAAIRSSPKVTAGVVRRRAGGEVDAERRVALSAVQNWLPASSASEYRFSGPIPMMPSTATWSSAHVVRLGAGQHVLWVSPLCDHKSVTCDAGNR
jgi:hypothetical protein